MKLSKRAKQHLQREHDRNERIFIKLKESTAAKAKNFIQIEINRGGKALPPQAREQMILKPIEFMDRSYVKMSILGLYRRYRDVRLAALQEALYVVMKNEPTEAISILTSQVVHLGRTRKKDMIKERKLDI